ncbi:MAG: hypothetical protein CVU81_02320 [Euryarchaeota archaeon HGW-Euryarchaeota-1]|nr:MAG: hypothetical protein CVU81_02320 [Euryarchaeota archaeon HGW-Euryarchaeota-1]
MPKLYLLGGESTKKKDSKQINQQAFLDAGGSPVVLLFPWTGRFTTAKKNKYRKPTGDYLKELGAKKVVFAELFDSQAILKEKITSSNLIYLPGGETVFLINRIKRKGIDVLLKNYSGVIIGNSAGTLALCKKYALIKGQDRNAKTLLEGGLGLVDFTVSVHYGSPIEHLSGISPEKELRQLSEKVKIYAIPEKCALIYDRGKLNSVGNVYVFDKGKKVRF